MKYCAHELVVQATRSVRDVARHLRWRCTAIAPRSSSSPDRDRARAAEAAQRPRANRAGAGRGKHRVDASVCCESGAAWPEPPGTPHPPHCTWADALLRCATITRLALSMLLLASKGRGRSLIDLAHQACPGTLGAGGQRARLDPLSSTPSTPHDNGVLHCTGCITSPPDARTSSTPRNARRCSDRDGPIADDDGESCSASIRATGRPVRAMPMPTSSRSNNSTRNRARRDRGDRPRDRRPPRPRHHSRRRWRCGCTRLPLSPPPPLHPHRSHAEQGRGTDL